MKQAAIEGLFIESASGGVVVEQWGKSKMNEGVKKMKGITEI